MAVQVKLVIGPSPRLLRERLLEAYRTAARDRPGSALWITNSPESIDEVRARLATAGALLSPRLFDWQGLAGRILRRLKPRAKPISAVRQRLILQQAVSELRRQKRLEYFDRIADSRGFLDSAAGLLAELAEAGIEPQQFVLAYASGSDADADGNPELDARSRKRRDMAALVSQYRSLIDNGADYDPNDAIRLAAEQLQAAQSSPFTAVESLFVDSGVELPAPQFELLRQLARWATHLWIGLPDAAGDEREELFRLARKTCESIRSAFVNAEIVVVGDEKAPAGLMQLRRNLFSGRRAAPPSPDGAGISLIEAPGALGEARPVARRLRQLLGDGVLPERVLVTVRRPARNRELLAEVFDEYCIPFDMEGEELLSRDPYVSTLLKAARLCEDNWPFEGVTALLRSTLARPAWADSAGDGEDPRRAEALLRMLGAPRGREAVLKAVDVWADEPPAALEDEDAEEPRRLKKARLAKQVRPFLRHFLRAWDRFPLNGAPGSCAKALRQFAEEFSLVPEAVAADQRQALVEFFRALDAWSDAATGARSAPLRKASASRLTESSLSRGAFFRILQTIAAGPRPPARSSAGKVRVRGAESAVALDADYLFILGLGEKEFPDLSPPLSLLDDADRHQFRQRRLPFSDSEERLPREMSLFHRLVALPAKELILSFPAVDPKGQPLLPSSFLRAVRDCFTSDAVVPERQRMLIEGYFQRVPIAESELRVRFAADIADRAVGTAVWQHPLLPARLTENLHDAARMASSRFHDKEFGVYDGMLSQPTIVQKLHERFGPNKTFSPTALEDYVACPFRFYLESVLRLEELDEPVEEVEASLRGSAFHRALARFHRELRDQNKISETMDGLNEAVSAKLTQDLDTAIDEYMKRAPSDAAQVLWQLEGRRLKRFSSRYHQQWESFAGPWREKSVTPAPLHLEVDFGLAKYTPEGVRIDPANPALTIQIGDVEVRIGGRIDRVDVAELKEGAGFWIVDYKTGLAENYKTTDLAEFKKLQLSLYALAVERVLLKDQKARPLGLAYWLVTDTGPKAAMPAGVRQRFDWLFKPENWQRFRQQLEEWVVKLVTNIRDGRFPLAPRSEYCTDTCPYGQICRISQSRNTGKVFALSLPGVGGSRDSD
jgi:ATP-dependent helicase/nuclease subunit B